MIVRDFKVRHNKNNFYHIVAQHLHIKSGWRKITLKYFRGSGFKGSEVVGLSQTRLPSIGQV